MEDILHEYPFRSVLSMKPLIDFWNRMDDSVGRRVALSEDLDQALARAPELLGPIGDVSELDRHQPLIQRLMSTVFPMAFWESDVFAAVVPGTFQPFWYSPAFQRLLLNEDGTVRGRPALEGYDYVRAKVMRAYFLILKECYGIEEGSYSSLIHVVPHPETGLDRYYGFKARLDFVEVRNVGGPERLSEKEKATVLHHLAAPEVIREILPPENFELRGFIALEATDVTQTEVLAALDRDLIDKNTVVSQAGFLRLQERLRILFNKPDLTAGLAAIRGEQTLLLSSGCEMMCNCIFGDSQHVSTSEFVGSVYERALQSGRITRVRDLQEEPNLTRADQETLDHGTRSLLIAPLHFQDRLIGTLKLGSPEPGAFRPTDELIANQLLPMFSMALQRSLEKLDNDVEAIIKQKCTAVHPSVEWRFRKTVFDHLESIHGGKAQEMAPIVFRDVHPLYGACDIRGSSEARNASIREDLSEHLNLALEVIRIAGQVKSLPVLQELSYQIGEHMERIRDDVSTGEEMAVTSFIHNEVEPVFGPLRSFGPRVTEAIAGYEREMDPTKRTVYRKRKAFEESVAMFNERLVGYLEREETEAQDIFPHYFDKHQTDGIDYVIYIGASMVEQGNFDYLYVRNLRIWQIMVACGLAWHADQLKSELTVPLNATHLILVNHNPLAIRFRFEEKRFDVDGAYNIGHEIIRSRIDKAVVKGRRERLTQPEKIAIVYSRPEEAREMQRHIDFLQSEGFLLDEVEHLELDDLPGVKGLRALRVGIDLESKALAARARRLSAQPPVPVRRAV